jgi:hypothetical protein
VARGAPQPSEETLRNALNEDRARLRLPPANGAVEIEVVGPHPIVVDGAELDEYVVWEK